MCLVYVIFFMILLFSFFLTSLLANLFKAFFETKELLVSIMRIKVEKINAICRSLKFSFHLKVTILASE